MFTALKDYLTTTKMTFSYKAVLVLALIESVDAHGEASQATLIERFHAFYLERQRRGLPAEHARERNPSPLVAPHEVTEAQVWQILSRYPLELMDMFIEVRGETVRFKPALWSQMRAADLAALREIAHARLDAYYAQT